MITIAHRLNTIYKSDKILVLGDGRVKAFGRKEEFTDEQMSFFYSYIKEMNSMNN